MSTIQKCDACGKLNKEGPDGAAPIPYPAIHLLVARQAKSAQRIIAADVCSPKCALDLLEKHKDAVTKAIAGE